MEYYSPIKNKLLPFAQIWTDLEVIILSKLSLKEKNKHYDITYMWKLKNTTK